MIWRMPRRWQWWLAAATVPSPQQYRQPPLPAFNLSNSVDLIARTIAQLTQFCIIQQRHNEEIRERNEEVRDIK